MRGVADEIGLYFVTGKITNENYGTGLWWNVIHNPQRLNEIFGMACTFFGIRFVVSIPPIRTEEKIARLGEVNGFDYSTAKIVYRPLNIILTSTSAGLKKINFAW